MSYISLYSKYILKLSREEFLVKELKYKEDRLLLDNNSYLAVEGNNFVLYDGMSKIKEIDASPLKQIYRLFREQDYKKVGALIHLSLLGIVGEYPSVQEVVFSRLSIFDDKLGEELGEIEDQEIKKDYKSNYSGVMESLKAVYDFYGRFANVDLGFNIFTEYDGSKCYDDKIGCVSLNTSYLSNPYEYGLAINIFNESRLLDVLYMTSSIFYIKNCMSKYEYDFHIFDIHEVNSGGKDFDMPSSIVKALLLLNGISISKRKRVFGEEVNYPRNQLESTLRDGNAINVRIENLDNLLADLLHALSCYDKIDYNAKGEIVEKYTKKFNEKSSPKCTSTLESVLAEARANK